MKTTDKKELQGKTLVELRKLLHDAEKELIMLRLDKEQNKLRNTRSIFFKRKTIAVLKTIMKTKEEQK